MFETRTGAAQCAVVMLAAWCLRAQAAEAPVDSATAAPTDQAPVQAQVQDQAQAQTQTQAQTQAQAQGQTPAPRQEVLTRHVDVLEYRIDGNHVLSLSDIETTLHPFLGPERTIEDIEKARAALEKTYRDKGYATVGVEIPEQDVRSGVVRLNVTELSVGRLRVTGSRYYSPEEIRRRFPALAEGTVPRYDLVGRDVERINRARDRTITPSLRAGGAPGTVDVDLQVEDHAPVHGSFEINDRYSTRTSRLRAVALVRYANLFQLDHSLSLQAQVSPEKLSETFLVSASYVAPLGDSPFTLITYGTHSKSDVAAVDGINVLGNGNIFGLRAELSLPGGDHFNQSLLAGFDYKDFKESLIKGADTGTTPIHYMPFTLEYSIAGLDKHGSTQARTGLTFGTRGLGSSDEEFRLKRYNANANFIYFRADLSRTQILPKDFRVTAELSGQLADQPLISNEGFSLGGLDSVRGYLEAQEVGDNGVRASLQIDSPSIGPYIGPSINEWRFFVFSDWGRIHILDALADLDKKVVSDITLASAGGGMRLRALERVNLLALLAAPLKQKEGLKLDLRDQYRAQFRFWVEF